MRRGKVILVLRLRAEVDVEGRVTPQSAQRWQRLFGAGGMKQLQTWNGIVH